MRQVLVEYNRTHANRPMFLEKQRTMQFLKMLAASPQLQQAAEVHMA